MHTSGVMCNTFHSMTNAKRDCGKKTKLVVGEQAICEAVLRLVIYWAVRMHLSYFIIAIYKYIYKHVYIFNICYELLP